MKAINTNLIKWLIYGMCVRKVFAKCQRVSFGIRLFILRKQMYALLLCPAYVTHMFIYDPIYISLVATVSRRVPKKFLGKTLSF